MERQRNDQALRETREILRDFPTSPRTHYLHACIQARLAKAVEGVVKKSLFDARNSLADAVENGIVKLFVLIGNEAERKAPLERIRKDPDLAPLFEKWPELSKHLDDYDYLRMRFAPGGGGPAPSASH